jgi:hypothetical protein
MRLLDEERRRVLELVKYGDAVRAQLQVGRPAGSCRLHRSGDAEIPAAGNQWRSPFKLKRDGTKAEVIAKFRRVHLQNEEAYRKRMLAVMAFGQKLAGSVTVLTGQGGEMRII